MKKYLIITRTAVMMAIACILLSGCEKEEGKKNTRKLEGKWESAEGDVIDISGSSGVYTEINSPAARSAEENGFIAKGEEYIKDIKEAAQEIEDIWNMKYLDFDYDSETDETTDVDWKDGTIQQYDDDFFSLTGSNGDIIPFTRINSGSSSNDGEYDLNGLWHNQGYWEISISGSSGKITKFDGRSNYWKDFVEEGILDINTQVLRNIQYKGNRKWDCEHLEIDFDNGWYSHWEKITFELDPMNSYIFRLPTLYFERGGLGSHGVIPGKDPGEGPDDEDPDKTGSLAFYTFVDFGTIQVTLEGIGSGTITRPLSTSTTATCGAYGTLTFENVPYGIYSYNATCAQGKWSGTITFAHDCLTFRLSE